MKKHFLWIIAFIMTISFEFCFIGCKAPELEMDTTPPAEVSNFLVTIENENAILTWQNPPTTDFVGVQISMTPSEGILENPISLGKSVTRFTVTGLRTETEYTFTIRTYDTSFNYSRGISEYIFIKNATINEKPGNTETVITKIEIPDVGVDYIGEIPVTIIGKNLLACDIICDESSFGNVELISDTQISATINNPGYVGTYKVTVSCGNSSGYGEFRVVECDYYSIGDILFTDGTRIKAENVQYGIPSTQKSKAFGIIVGFNRYLSKPLIMGLREGVSLKWASHSTAYTAFTEIQGGDIDGSDNWEYICSIDPEGTKNPSSNYPAFNFANTYGDFAELIGTDYAYGWYLPSIAELYKVYENITTIQASLDTVGVFSLKGSYWSSSQHTSYYENAYYFYLLNDLDSKVGDAEKYSDFNNVLVFKTLTGKLFNDYEYGLPEISSVEIPTIGTSYIGVIDIVINGRNFCGPNFDISQLYCSRDITNIELINAEKIKVSFLIPSYNGDSENVTVSIGSSTVTEELKFIECDYYSVGDILFTDGTRIKAENIRYGIPKDQKSKAFAIVAGLKNYGTIPIVIGLQKGSSLEWARLFSTGYHENFLGIQGTISSGDMDGSDNWDYICSIDPEGSRDAATNYPAFNFVNTYGRKANLEGTAYGEGWYLPTIAELYEVSKNNTKIQDSLDSIGADSIGGLYWSSSPEDVASYVFQIIDPNYMNNNNIKSRMIDEFYLSCKSNENDVLALKGIYTVFYDYIYKIPEITSVEIPTVKSGYTGTVSVIINGKNFVGPDFNIDQLYSSKTLSSVYLIDDTEIGAEIYCNGYSENVTFSIGSSSVTATLKVEEQKPGPEIITKEDIGKIVLSDGSFVSKEDFNSSTMTPVAVIAGFKNEGRDVIALGLKRSSADLIWAKKGTIGYNTNFTELQSESLGNNIYTGNVDGYYNWEYICSIDPEGSQDAATNYPAYNFANTYGEFAGLTGTKYSKGWYLPTIAELAEIRKNRDIIQASLDVVGGFKIFTSSVYYYLSSNQSPGISGVALEQHCLSLHMNDPNEGFLSGGKASKLSERRILVIRTL